MLLGLEREGVRVDTGVGATGVVVEGLHLVEVLTRLFLETVLAVEDELEGGEGTDFFFGEVGLCCLTLTNHKHGGTRGRGVNETVRAIVVMRGEQLVGLLMEVIDGRSPEKLHQIWQAEMVLRQSTSQL